MADVPQSAPPLHSPPQSGGEIKISALGEGLNPESPNLLPILSPPVSGGELKGGRGRMIKIVLPLSYRSNSLSENSRFGKADALVRRVNACYYGRTRACAFPSNVR